MNELVKISNSIVKADRVKVAATIMSVCRSITPQFYRNLSPEEVAIELAGIELLCSPIPQDVLSDMCRLAVMAYPKFRSKDHRQYFDINFVMMFYEDARKLHWERLRDATREEYDAYIAAQMDYELDEKGLPTGKLKNVGVEMPEVWRQWRADYEFYKEGECKKCR